MMTTILSDILSVPALEKELEAGYVKRVIHYAFPYAILNYTDKCQFDNRWNDVTMNCRGLIYNYETFEVIARGMPKFFNYSQPGAAVIGLDDIVHVADKADGSLGILYPTPDGDWAVATRGSFESEQALWATQFLRNYVYYRATKADLEDLADREESAVVEIIYPNNRIVVNYGDTHELRFLGTVGIVAGEFYFAEEGDEYWWPFGVSQSFGEMTYSEALALPPRPNAEGLVLTRVSDGAMVKVKQEDYLRLHKAIFGLSARKLWEVIALGGDMDAYIAALPDELQPWAKETVRSLFVLHDAKIAYLQETFNEIMDTVERIYGAETWDRADFAREVTIRGGADTGYLFALLDGKNIDMMLWRRSRPEAGISPVLVDHGEDVA